MANKRLREQIWGNDPRCCYCRKEISQPSHSIMCSDGIQCRDCECLRKTKIYKRWSACPSCHFCKVPLTFEEAVWFNGYMNIRCKSCEEPKEIKTEPIIIPKASVPKASVPKRYPNKNRRELWEKQPWCTYCKKTLDLDEVTRDHVVPRVKGGQTVPENIVVACGPCNQAKSGRDATEFIAWLNSDPRPVLPHTKGKKKMPPATKAQIEAYRKICGIEIEQ
jgi:5-methylcytosine-specific restriction endonuclease McrA